MSSNVSFLQFFAPYSDTELSLVWRRRQLGLDWCLLTSHFFFLLSTSSLSLVLPPFLRSLIFTGNPPAWDLSALALRHRAIPGWDHFIVLLRSLSFTRKASVTFFPLRASPPFFRSFLPTLSPLIVGPCPGFKPPLVAPLMLRSGGESGLKDVNMRRPPPPPTERLTCQYPGSESRPCRSEPTSLPPEHKQQSVRHHTTNHSRPAKAVEILKMCEPAGVISFLYSITKQSVASKQENGNKSCKSVVASLRRRDMILVIIYTGHQLSENNEVVTT